jgi:glucose-1-phosphate thymidylyltransferase
MKGIILSGGSGTRLSPITSVISKQLTPVYDKPMVYYPLSTLITSGIKEILLITNPEYISMYQKLLGDGSQFGVSIEYKAQESPRGIAEAFILAGDFIGDDAVCLILGDNIFYSSYLKESLLQLKSWAVHGCGLLGTTVQNPKRYGVAEVDGRGRVFSIEEKPENPKSKIAVTGLYMYDNSVIEKAKSLTPSYRGELEITDLNQMYIEEESARLLVLNRGLAWLDMGTFDSLLQSAQFVQSIQQRQGILVGSPHEAAFLEGFIDCYQLSEISEMFINSEYGKYLKEYGK